MRVIKIWNWEWEKCRNVIIVVGFIFVISKVFVIIYRVEVFKDKDSYGWDNE